MDFDKHKEVVLLSSQMLIKITKTLTQTQIFRASDLYLIKKKLYYVHDEK